MWKEVDKKEIIMKFFNGEIDIESDEYIIVDFEYYSIGCFLDEDIKSIKEMVTNDNIKLFHKE